MMLAIPRRGLTTSATLFSKKPKARRTSFANIPSDSLPRPVNDPPLVRISRTMAYLLRHSGQREGLAMTSDGFVRVRDLLEHPNMRSVNFQTLQNIVRDDKKNRYYMKFDTMVTDDGTKDSWWICARQGHSIPEVALDLEPIFSAKNMPVVIHGTTEEAWKAIAQVGIHRMNRNHIHLARGFAQDGVLSGIRSSSKVLIYIDVAKALAYGIPFFLSKNGVVLTPGNKEGYLPPQVFHRVERVGRTLTRLPLQQDGPDTQS
ncbi:hypothetical protein CYLTODRAFT_365398 [Cylindrobasidium torrendii FP15055 ss-10]|uniref:2'-phosphotransferase n=1 Tax=Cylindrobasidium torrendii FP15055 ss-10 TaxID=1314674 RepID=A0A0D7BU83_9AGAR|nr:hypothetical protein CYLTODRAFT_365398 [Cylindrobasidium torrendii FP15055 ss-10]